MVVDSGKYLRKDVPMFHCVIVPLIRVNGAGHLLELSMPLMSTTYVFITGSLKQNLYTLKKATFIHI